MHRTQVVNRFELENNLIGDHEIHPLVAKKVTSIFHRNQPFSLVRNTRDVELNTQRP